MHIIRYMLALLIVLLFTQAAFSQTNRITYNNQNLFLSGSNLAWVNYGSDWGLGTTDTTTMADWMVKMHQHGGNAMRVWLNVEGNITPKFDSFGYCTGPGTVLIPELKKVLDLAWDREIGINICLWGFGMLGPFTDTSISGRNWRLLTDTSYTNTYIRNCLIPMVAALKGHPAILTWEIFNEPEGMSNEYGWTSGQRVQMSYIQQFVNLCAGAIHRTDASALVTNGAWSFYVLTDNTLAKAGNQFSKLSSAEKQQIGAFYQQKYGSTLSADEIITRLQKIASGPTQNYYRDDRLIAAGHDPDGTLDFYSVHYYNSSTPLSTSPFHHTASSWNLTKPIVVAEFAMQNAGKGENPPGIAKTSLYDTLYQLGYAGALAWSWSDSQLSPHADMLAGMQSIWNKYREDIEIFGTGAYWPIISIKSPQDGAKFPDTNQVTIELSVTDSVAITSVDIFVSNTLKIATLTATPYTYTWTNIAGGIYNITAVATNSLGHTQTSSIVKITVGTPPMVRLEAEAATRTGPGMSIVTDAIASGGKYVNIAGNDPTTIITWTLNNVPAAGNYPIAFGYKLNAGTPKSQFINVNGVRAFELEFTATSPTTWYERDATVSLAQGSNTIQMQMSWGWMAVDYLAVPRDITTSVERSSEVPLQYSLQQNYPNPFNPSTIIRYSLPHSGYVKLFVYDILGRQVAALVDEKQDAGVYEAHFNASLLTSGVYFYRLNIGTFTQTKKMIVLK